MRGAQRPFLRCRIDAEWRSEWAYGAGRRQGAVVMRPLYAQQRAGVQRDSEELPPRRPPRPAGLRGPARGELGALLPQPATQRDRSRADEQAALGPVPTP